MKYMHVSFAFTVEDKDILEHCAEQSGLTQTELIRRLLRHLASGGEVTGVGPIRNHKSAIAWAKSIDVDG